MTHQEVLIYAFIGMFIGAIVGAVILWRNADKLPLRYSPRGGTIISPGVYRLSCLDTRRRILEVRQIEHFGVLVFTDVVTGELGAVSDLTFVSAIRLGDVKDPVLFFGGCDE